LYKLDTKLQTLLQSYKQATKNNTSPAVLPGSCNYIHNFIKPPLATARAAVLSICSSVCHCLSPKHKNAIFLKTKQFRVMVSIDDL